LLLFTMRSGSLPKSSIALLIWCTTSCQAVWLLRLGSAHIIHIF
jgi:hypothetical protein